jgi:hypothetical protein
MYNRIALLILSDQMRSMNCIHKVKVKISININVDIDVKSDVKFEVDVEADVRQQFQTCRPVM